MRCKVRKALGLVLLCPFGSAIAQYSGPALLTRGEAPAALAGTSISFRPFLSVAGTYTTGLADVSVNSAGELANTSSAGGMLIWGLSGSHAWRRTRVGLDYRGSVAHYTKKTAFDSVNQTALLSVNHDVTRHIHSASHVAVGTFSRDFGLLGMPQAVAFDPLTAQIPRTDFFDNRTNYVSAQQDLIIQKSARLSLAIGGSGFVTTRRSTALSGVNGAIARADVHYRLSRKNSVGGVYSYTRYFFTRADSGTDMHAIAGSYATRLTRWWEISGYGGVTHMESKFTQSVQVDPVISAILGVQSSTAIVHRIEWRPYYAVRVSRTFRRGVAHASVANSTTPGNGLFLTSRQTMFMGGYAYTGLRRWSLSAIASASENRSLMNYQGGYRSLTGTLSMSRRLIGALHIHASYSAREYGSPDFAKYNRLVHSATIGFGFTPRDVPLRVW